MMMMMKKKTKKKRKGGRAKKKQRRVKNGKEWSGNTPGEGRRRELRCVLTPCARSSGDAFDEDLAAEPVCGGGGGADP